MSFGSGIRGGTLAGLKTAYSTVVALVRCSMSGWQARASAESASQEPTRKK